ncbi:MAG TPA: HEPN domain-containing protein [Rhizomicrobium sp.]|nr:HEPN domain-containing protein [Rhizomicrobium sp.]
MSPETVNYFVVAEKQLAQAERALDAGLYEFAARESYLTALSAARAIIFEKTGDAPKTHSGARSQLTLLQRGGLDIDPSFLAFLATGFELKSDLDYGPVTPVDKSVAERALSVARAFVKTARSVLARND